jgi:hypothetical protein
MISVHETEKLSLQQIEQFLLAAKEVRFEASQREEIYGWVERLLCQQEYVGHRTEFYNSCCPSALTNSYPFVRG